MEQISKPHIVDLLRIFDKRKWLHPRILYASVRSKPDLIKDIKKHFSTRTRSDVLQFRPRADLEDSLRHLPNIAYDFGKRRYLFDGEPFDVPAESRKKVKFSISHKPVTLTFEP